MLNGHSSHQIGLDVDIWFTPMPDHELSQEEREFDMALNMVAKDGRNVDRGVWTHERTALVHAAAQDPVGHSDIRQSGNKKSYVSRNWAGSFLVVQGPPLVGTRRAFPRSPGCPPIAYNANRNPQWLRTTDAAMSSNRGLRKRSIR